MSFAERVIFDTSTLVGALLRPSSVPRQAFQIAMAQAELCASVATLDELESVLLRDKFDRYLDRASRQEFFETYRRGVRLFPVSDADEKSLRISCRDPRDNKFLALALTCSADMIVSSDEDLLALHPYYQISVVSPREFFQQKVIGSS